MCGIAGIVSQYASKMDDVVRKMLRSMQHRGPDGEGLWLSRDGNCALGHRRLSIIDLSALSAQPMLSSGEQHALTYNGEIYNYAKLKDQQKSKGHVFRSTGDTEVLLNLLVESGEQCLFQLNGMFALGFWNETTGKLLLARDRYGQKPLYFARVNEGFIFASEVRALLASGLISRKACRQGILGYLRTGAVQEPFTVVENVYMLPAASSIEVDVQSQSPPSYFWRTPDKIERTPQVLQEQFEHSVERHFESDVPVAIFLSGGIDSSAIALAAHSSKRAHLSTVTVICPEAATATESKARLVAELIGSRHLELPLSTASLFAELEQAIEAFDQPSVDALNTYFVSKAVSSLGLKVALSGLGADEIFGGYPSFKDVPEFLSLSKFIASVGFVSNWLPATDRKLDKLGSLISAAPTVLEQYIARRQVFSRRLIDKLARDKVEECGLHPFTLLSDQRMSRIADLISDCSVVDCISQLELNVYMGQMLLRDTDCMGMNHSLEIRAPFLDAEFSQSVLSMPDRIRSPKSAQSKWFLVQMLKDWWPPQLLGLPKKGFELPMHTWITSGLAKRVESSLAAAPNELFNGREVMELWRAFLRDPNKVGWVRIWCLFVLFEYIRRHGLK